jgi:hypothetical protein
MSEMTAEKATDWLLNQTILGIDYENDSLKLVFKQGYLEISGDDFEVYVETE